MNLFPRQSLRKHECMQSRCSLPLALLLSLFLWGARPHFALARVVISEVLWAGSDLSASDEWLEISCVDEPATMSGWLLTSLNSSGIEVPVLRFPAETAMTPGTSFIISHFAEDSSRLLYTPRFVTSSLSLPNTKLRLRLYDAGNELVDEVDDGVGNPFAGTNAASPDYKASMERIHFLFDGNEKTNWRTATESYDLDSDTLVYATPGYFLYSSSSVQPEGERENVSSEFGQSSSAEEVTEVFSSSAASSSVSSQNFSVSSSSSVFSASSTSATLVTSATSVTSAPALRLSEVLPNPPGSDDAEWIELRNTESVPIDLRGLKIIETHSHTSFTVPLSGGSDWILEPGGYRALRHSITNVSLPQAGGEVQLVWSGAVIDSVLYPELPENVSFGRRNPLFAAMALCIPTEAQVNDDASWNAVLSIQSGSTQGEESVSLNTQILPHTGSFDGASCKVQFGDGDSIDSCNPPSHTYDVGSFTLRAEIKNYCGTTVIQTLPIFVKEKPKSEPEKQLITEKSSASSSKKSGSSSLSSVAAGPVRHDALLLYSVLPNPEGKDDGREKVSIINVGSVPTEAQSLQLRIQTASSTKTVDIHIPALAPHTSITLSGKDLPLTLTNDNVTLSLLALDEYILDTVEWSKTKEDQLITHALDVSTTIRGIATKVIDGDTIDIAFTDSALIGIPFQKTERVRFTGVNTPEISSKFPEEKHMADKAKEFISVLTEDQILDLQFDTISRDVYGRLLAYVSLSDGRLLQKELIMNGYAIAEDAFPHMRKDEFLSWQTTAKDDGQNIWKTDQISSSKAQNIIEEEPFMESIKRILTPQKNTTKKAPVVSKKVANAVSIPSPHFRNEYEDVVEGIESQSGSELPSLFADLIPQANAATASLDESAFETPFFSLPQAIFYALMIGLLFACLWYLGKIRHLW